MSTVYVVELTDLTHLGGMMGSEYTTSIGASYAYSLEGARAVFRDLALARRVPAAMLPSTPELGRDYDFGHVGITMREVAVAP